MNLMLINIPSCGPVEMVVIKFSVVFGVVISDVVIFVVNVEEVALSSQNCPVKSGRQKHVTSPGQNNVLIAF